MTAGLREAKFSRNKKIKVQFFSTVKTEDLMFHLSNISLNLKSRKKNLQHHYSY